MELKINLADREEIAAAIPLLQVILDNTTKTPGSGKCSGDALLWKGKIQNPAEIAADINHTVTKMYGADSLPQEGDPATVFGGAPAPLQPGAMPAPFTAAAVASPIAPVAMPASSELPPAPTPFVPTPAAAAGAPSEPAAPLIPAPGVDLDTKGLPWDDRIHASTKSKIADGSWKMKRGVEDVLVTQVEAELRARVAQPASAPAPAVAAAPAPFVPPAASLAPAPAVASLEPATFEQIMPRVTAAVIAGRIPQTALGQACAANGLASIVALQSSPALVPQVWATLVAQYPGLV